MHREKWEDIIPAEAELQDHLQQEEEEGGTITGYHQGLPCSQTKCNCDSTVTDESKLGVAQSESAKLKRNE